MLLIILKTIPVRAEPVEARVDRKIKILTQPSITI